MVYGDSEMCEFSILICELKNHFHSSGEIAQHVRPDRKHVEIESFGEESPHKS